MATRRQALYRGDRRGPSTHVRYHETGAIRSLSTPRANSLDERAKIKDRAISPGMHGHYLSIDLNG